MTHLTLKLVPLTWCFPSSYPLQLWWWAAFEVQHQLCFICPLLTSAHSHSSEARFPPGCYYNWQRQKRCYPFWFLDVYVCGVSVCVSVHKCLYMWRQWCVQWCIALSSPVQDIISQSLGLMERGEWWELCLPAENENEGDRWCVSWCRPGCFFAWHGHLTPETKAAAAQQATADVGLIVIERAYSVTYCLNMSFARVMAAKHSLFYNASHLERGW